MSWNLLQWRRSATRAEMSALKMSSPSPGKTMRAHGLAAEAAMLRGLAGIQRLRSQTERRKVAAALKSRATVGRVQSVTSCEIRLFPDHQIIFTGHINFTDREGRHAFVAPPNFESRKYGRLFISPRYSLKKKRSAVFVARPNYTDPQGNSFFVAYPNYFLDHQPVFVANANCIVSGGELKFLPQGLSFDKNGRPIFIAYTTEWDSSSRPLFAVSATQKSADGKLFFVSPTIHVDKEGNRWQFVAPANKHTKSKEPQFEAYANNRDEIGQPIFSALYNYKLPLGVSK